LIVVVLIYKQGIWEISFIASYYNMGVVVFHGVFNFRYYCVTFNDAKVGYLCTKGYKK